MLRARRRRRPFLPVPGGTGWEGPADAREPGCALGYSERVLITTVEASMSCQPWRALLNSGDR